MASLESSGRSFNSFELYPSQDLQSISDPEQTERKFVFRILIAINIILNYDSGVIPASLVQIQNEMDLTFTEKAALGSLVYLGLSAASLIVSPVFQRYSASRTLVFMLCLNCGFCLLFSFSHSVPVMYLGRLGMGFTQAFSVIYAPVWINEFSPKQKETRWIGILQASVPIGVVLGYSIAAFINITELTTWRFAIQLQALFELPLIVWFAHINKEDIDIIDHTQESLQLVTIKEQLHMLFSNKIYLAITPALCCMYFVVGGIQYWITLYMIKVLLIPAVATMFAFVIVSITAPICGIYVGGHVGDFMGGYKGNHIVPALKFCLISGFLASLCTVPVAISTTAFTEFVSLWLLLFLGACLVPCATGISINSVQREYQSNASSFAQLSFNLFGFFLAPILSGLVMEHYSTYEVGLTFGIRFILCFSWIGCAFMLFTYILAKKYYSGPLVG